MRALRLVISRSPDAGIELQRRLHEHRRKIMGKRVVARLVAHDAMPRTCLMAFTAASVVLTRSCRSRSSSASRACTFTKASNTQWARRCHHPCKAPHLQLGEGLGVVPATAPPRRVRPPVEDALAVRLPVSSLSVLLVVLVLLLLSVLLVMLLYVRVGNALVVFLSLGSL